MSMTPTVSLPGATVWMPWCFGVHEAVLAPEDPPQAVRPKLSAIALAVRMPAPLRRWVFMVPPGDVGVLRDGVGWLFVADCHVCRAMRFSKKTVIHVAGMEMAA